MPIYEFKCNKCNNIFEQMCEIKKQSIKCPKCKKESQKIISKSSFIIKGYSEANGYSKK